METITAMMMRLLFLGLLAAVQATHKSANTVGGGSFGGSTGAADMRTHTEAMLTATASALESAYVDYDTNGADAGCSLSPSTCAPKGDYGSNMSDDWINNAPKHDATGQLTGINQKHASVARPNTSHRPLFLHPLRSQPC